MEYYLVRFLKPIALALICVISVYYLTKSISVALTIGSVPLLLGWLGIMQGFAYGLAALTFLASTAWAVTPNEVKGFLREQATLAIETVQRETTAKR